MRSVLLALLILLPALASAVTAKDLEGHWVVDPEATWTMLQEHAQTKAQFAAMPTEQQAMIKSLVLGKMAQASWSLSEGKADIVEPDGTQRTSSWTVTRTRGETLTVEAVDEKGTTRTGTLTLDGDRLVARGFSGPRGKGQPESALVLRRGERPAAK
jgi:hypothetical protein